MRLTALSISVIGAPALASLLAALKVAASRPKTPPAPAAAPRDRLPLRVRAALQAAARARR